MKYFYISLGFVSLILGIIGMFLPILPTTPFLLLTAWSWLKSSDKLYEKLMAHPRLGEYIRDFQINKCIPLKTKIISVSMLWITILLSIIYATDMLWLRILLFIIASGVSVHILSFKTKR